MQKLEVGDRTRERWGPGRVGANRELRLLSRFLRSISIGLILLAAIFGPNLVGCSFWASRATTGSTQTCDGVQRVQARARA